MFLPLPKEFHLRTNPFHKVLAKNFSTFKTEAATPNRSYNENIADRTLLRVRMVGNVAHTLNQKKSRFAFQSRPTPSTRLVKQGFKSKVAHLYCSAIAGVGNLFLVAGQKQTLQVMAGRTNFPPTIRFRLLIMMLLKLGNLWNS